MDKQVLIDKLASLLMETGQAHHPAFVKTDGVDPDWADWYGDYLKEKLPSLLGAELATSQITDELKALDEKFADYPGTEHWAGLYAQDMVSKFA